MRGSPTVYPLSALPISRPQAAQHHFHAASKKDRGLTEKGGQWQRLEQSAQLGMRTCVSASSPAKKPSTWPRRDSQREDTLKEK